MQVLNSNASLIQCESNHWYTYEYLIGMLDQYTCIESTPSMRFIIYTGEYFIDTHSSDPIREWISLKNKGMENDYYRYDREQNTSADTLIKYTHYNTHSAIYRYANT